LTRTHLSRTIDRDHIEPIWQALPLEARGVFAGRCGDHTGRWDRDHAVIVASWADAKRVAPRPFVYVEHGSGQSYDGHAGIERVGGYSAAAGLDDCSLFLSPNETVAKRWRFAYPNTRNEVVGCPRLDVARARHLLRDGGADSRTRRRDPYSAHSEAHPSVAFSFHWDCTIIPETRSAWPHYARGMRSTVDELRRRGYDLVGHGHPRDAGMLGRRWYRLGVPYWPDSMQVLTDADVLVADNTSLLWEFAAMGKPIVLLDAPWYRRDVEHGLRFWTHADAGPRVSDAESIPDAVDLAVRDSEQWRTNRRRAVDDVYSGLDGSCADRAAQAIMTTIGATR
jgi:hypothetical protein